jgi:hypothetical protein
MLPLEIMVYIASMQEHPMDVYHMAVSCRKLYYKLKDSVMWYTAQKWRCVLHAICQSTQQTRYGPYWYSNYIKTPSKKVVYLYITAPSHIGTFMVFTKHSNLLLHRTVHEFYIKEQFLSESDYTLREILDSVSL